MRAYKFLLDGAVGPFSGQRWPAPGEWVEAEAGPVCAAGVHACEPGDLPFWLQVELWEIELRGPVARGRHKLVAPAGRLVARVDAWDDETRTAFGDACLERVRELAARRPEGEGHLGDLERFRPHVQPAAIASLAARAAEAVEGRAGYDAERAAQAAWLARRLGLEAGAA